MKKVNLNLFFFIIIMLVIATVLSSCSINYYEYKLDFTTLHLSPTMCEWCLDGVTPKDFCQTRGKNTFLEDRYLFAWVDKDGCLILTLSNDVVHEWKNSFTIMHVLQCVLGESRDIGIDVDYSKDFVDFMKDAHTCGFEISEDFTQVIDSPDDNSWYFPMIVTACATEQVFQGKTCTEVIVEYIVLNEDGEVVERLFFPDGVSVDTSNSVK